MANENILQSITLNGKTFTMPEGGGGGDGNALYVNLTVDYSDGENYPKYGLDKPIKDIVEHITGGGAAYIVNSVLGGDRVFPTDSYMPTPVMLMPVMMYGKRTVEEQGMTGDIYLLGSILSVQDSRANIAYHVLGMGFVVSGETVSEEIDASYDIFGGITIGNITSGASTTKLWIADAQGQVDSYSRLRESAQGATGAIYYTDMGNNYVYSGQIITGRDSETFVFLDGSGNGVKKVTVVITDDGNDGLSYTLTETVIS